VAGYGNHASIFPTYGMNETSGHPPRINQAVNIKALPLEPEEAFVYSRVDGRSESKDIALTTGLPLERVERALLRLGELGALERSAAAANHVDVGVSSFVALPDIDLGEAEQCMVFQLWQNLPNLDHYELLGLERTATRSQIKESYFQKVAAFHPDKHFGKRLGPFKEKLEVVFQRLTIAHDTLGRSRRREDYDASLPPSPSKISVTSTSEQPVIAARGSGPARASVPPHPSGPPVAPTLIPPHAPLPFIPTAQDPVIAHGIEPRANYGQRAVVAPSVRPIAPIPSVPPGAVVHGLSKPQARLNTPSIAPVSDEKRRELAAHSITRGLRHLGTKGLESLRPRNSPKPADYSSAPPSSRSIMLEQAQVAAARAEWDRAGSLFAKVAAEQKDGHLFGRAGECYAQGSRGPESDSLRKAIDCARQAVSLAPNNGQFRLSLSRLYADAGLMKSAIGEAERAQELSPGDKRVQSWVQHLRQRDEGTYG
jgi:hypothetical protein